ncbi:MAG TPA: alpha/beta family hydrolase [Kineosporiaceae bacterium]|nr:alpha/beta family hydrolase [Kineosporiaceae bacterium]
MTARPDHGPSPLVREVPTPLGPARLHLHLPPAGGAPAGTLVLGHGAGGGIEAADLVAVAAAGTGIGWRVVLVEQPWRVAGKKVAPAPARLDVGWLAALDGLAALDAGAEPDTAADPGTAGGGDLGRGAGTGGPADITGGPADITGGPADIRNRPLVVGGRSAGARVACRTAAPTGASAVVCLSFPLHPPGRPERSRAGELAGAGVPVLVVQGERDPFGRPGEVSAAVSGVEVVAVPGDHGLTPGAAEAAAAVSGWLRSL